MASSGTNNRGLDFNIIERKIKDQSSTANSSIERLKKVNFYKN